MRAVIIDDEEGGIHGLRMLIEKHVPAVKVVDSTTDPLKGIELINNYRPDVVFLDVSMPRMDGFQVLEKIQYRDFSLVFTTAHGEYAIQAIKSKAHDYLLKPIVADELKRCIDSIADRRSESAQPVHRKVIELAVKDGIIFIKPEEIVRLEASGSYTTFFLDNHVRHVASRNLKECEKLLEHPRFYRCHPSHIVNLAKVIKLVSNEGLFAQMSDGSMAEVSRKNKESFLEHLKTY
jgi:two-component system, LytTR family, response regulator